MSGKSESDATYCSEAEAILAQNEMRKKETLMAHELRRSQRLSEKTPNIKIRFNWDNFRINRTGKLIHKKRKLKSNACTNQACATQVHSVDIMAELADTQTHSESLPPNQKTVSIDNKRLDGQVTSTEFFTETPGRKRKLTECLAREPEVAFQDVLVDEQIGFLDLVKKPKCDINFNCTTVPQKEIIYIDLTKSDDNISLPPPALNIKDASNNEDNLLFKSSMFGLKRNQTNDFGQHHHIPFLDNSQEHLINTCNQIRKESNGTSGPMKTQKRIYKPRKPLGVPKRRNNTKVKEPPPKIEKAVITKYMNLADFTDRENQEAKQQSIHQPTDRQKPEVIQQTINQPTPKIQPFKPKRYFDNRTQRTTDQRKPFGESLLPAIYPSYFREQIPVTDSMLFQQNKVFNSDLYLTPDLSQSYEFEPRSSTPSLPDSLREVFDSNDLREILQLEKVVYHLSDQHVKALSVVLNLKVEYLQEVLDKILTLSSNDLQTIDRMLLTLPAIQLKENTNENNAARTRPFNHATYKTMTESSSESSVIECSQNEKEFRHFASQRWTQ